MDIQTLTSQEDKIKAAIEEIAQSLPDVRRILQKHGVQLDQDSTIDFAVDTLTSDSGIGATKGKPDKCVTVCVRVGFAKVCYKDCF